MESNGDFFLQFALFQTLGINTDLVISSDYTNSNCEGS
jgi:hypothetical protein